MSAQCVCSKINESAFSDSSVHFFPRVYISTVQTCTQGKISRFFASVFGMEAWVTAWRRLLEHGYEWVLPPAKSCQSDGREGAPFSLSRVVLQMKGNIPAERHTDKQTKTGEWQANRNVDLVIAWLIFYKDVQRFFMIIDAALIYIVYFSCFMSKKKVSL